MVCRHFPNASTHNVLNETANCAVAANASYFLFCLQGVHKIAARCPSNGPLPLNAISFVCRWCFDVYVPLGLTGQVLYPQCTSNSTALAEPYRWTRRMAWELECWLDTNFIVLPRDT